MQMSTYEIMKKLELNKGWEGEYYVISCHDIAITSFGETECEAEIEFHDELELFVADCRRLGTFELVFTEILAGIR